MKDLLLQFGLTEEQATQLVTEIEKMPMIPKKRFDEVNNKKNALQEEIKNYESSIEELKNNANGDEDLKAQLQKLQDEQSTLKAEYEQKLSAERINAALKLSLNGKAHDADLVLSLLNRESIKIDENGNITEGLEEQLKSLQESKSFLFVQQEKQEETPVQPTPPTTIQGWNPVVSDKQQPEGPTSIGAMIASQLNGK